MDQNFVFPKDVKGWFWPEEGELLFELAQKNKKLGVVVELGSYHGKSTICLAQGCKQMSNGKVYAVDNFVGDKYSGLSKSFLSVFKQNIKEHDLTDWVEPIEGDFHTVSKSWKKPIRLLFIDGAHSYQDIKRDVEDWEKYLVPNGILACDDSLVWPGVTKLVRELIESGRFANITNLNSGGTITYMTKLPPQVHTEQMEIKKYLKEFDSLVKKRFATRIWLRIRDGLINR